MKKLLITLVAAFTLPTAVFSGIPQNKNPEKWVRINENWTIDTEDVEVKSGKLRFYMKRNATKKDFEGPSQYIQTYTGKVRVNCDKFTAGIQVRFTNGFGGYYGPIDWNSITPEHVGYDLAKYFCFLTGSEGYTQELIEPYWVSKIIKSAETKKIERKEKLGNINCDSPVWKNKPRCN